MATELSPKANWLGRYLSTERDYDATLVATLNDAAENLHSKLVALKDKDTASAAEQRYRYSRNMKEIDATLKALFGKVRTGIKAGRQTAAGAAADAKAYEDTRFLETLFPDETQRQSYIASLNQTAQRNIESVMARELETKLTLSQQVYKTQALSKGFVSREINRALARGDGAKEIADAVRDMIRPDVPGGVSYAAMRLGRTEVHNAFHAQSRHEIEESPFTTQARWNLSKTHEEIGCVCEDYADQGLFDKGDIPDSPHPQCRCYITGEQMSWEDFENQLLAGRFDNTKIQAVTDAMQPEQKVAPTTKAGQPEDWTGHPIAKAAANRLVINTIDRLFHKYSGVEKSMQFMREGSRIVQAKGYRGGLSAPGKKAILAQENNLIGDEKMMADIGRELTVRAAYAPKSTESVYSGSYGGPNSLLELRNLAPNNGVITMPLTRFERTVGSAVNEFQFGTGQGTAPNVIFEVKPGARIADAGNSRVGLGKFRVTSTAEGNHPTGGKYTIVRLEQIDTREEDVTQAFKGATIPDWDLVQRVGPQAPVAPVVNSPVTLSGGSTKPSGPNPPGFAHGRLIKDEILDKKLSMPVRNNVKDMITPEHVQRLLRDKYPNLDISGMTSTRIPEVAVAEEMAVAIDELFEEMPTLAEHLKSFSIKKPSTDRAYAEVAGYYGDSRSDMVFNSKWAKAGMSDMKWSRQSGVDQGWTPKGAGSQPFRSVIIHEMGHVIDNSGDRRARGKVLALVHDEARKAGVDIHGSGYGMWVRQHTASKYSLLQKGPSKNAEVNPPETLAEAFLDVQLNGAQAKPLSHKLYDLLMDSAFTMPPPGNPW